MRRAFAAFAPFRSIRKVSIFGSARTAASKAEYKQAVEFGKKISDAGFMVITGAGGGIGRALAPLERLEKEFGDALAEGPFREAARSTNAGCQRAFHPTDERIAGMLASEVEMAVVPAIQQWANRRDLAGSGK